MTQGFQKIKLKKKETNKVKDIKYIVDYCLTSGLRRKTVRNPRQGSKAKRERLPINCNEKDYIIFIKTDKGVSYELETSASNSYRNITTSIVWL